MTNDTTPRAACEVAPVADAETKALFVGFRSRGHLMSTLSTNAILALVDDYAKHKVGAALRAGTLASDRRRYAIEVRAQIESAIDALRAACEGAGSIPREFPDNLALNTSLPGDALIALFRDNSIPMSDANQRLFDVIDRSFSEAGSIPSEAALDNIMRAAQDLQRGYAFVGDHNFPENRAKFREVVRAALAVPSDRCSNCDDSGDVHSIDGEWRGVCHCPAGDKYRTAVPREGKTK